MKKTWGKIVVAVLFAAAAFFAFFPINAGHYPLNTQAASTNTYFPGRYNIFKAFDDESGIFILKDTAAETDPTAYFYGDIGITGESKMTGYTDFRYEAVRETDGVWQRTDWFQVIVGWNKLSVEYHLPKRLPAGKYGVRVTVLSGGTEVYDFDADLNYRPISSTYVLMYAEDLNYIYCTDAQGNSIYSARSQGLGRTVTVGVSVNSGAMTFDDLIVQKVSGAEIGNLTLPADITLTTLGLRLENARGEEIDRGVLSYEVRDNAIDINIPNKLAAGQYYLRVYHPTSTEIYGTYIIDNSSVGGMSELGGVGIAFLVIGLLVILSGAGLFVWPRLAYKARERQFQRSENDRYMRGVKDDKAWKAQSALSSYKNASQIAESRALDTHALTEEQKIAVNAVRSEEFAQTKSGGFLQKMYENRLKRDIAREAGLSMEEFKEIESRQKKIEAAEAHSLSAFRKAVEDKTGVITKQGTGQTEQKPAGQQVRQADGQPEFELLDSVKQEQANAKVRAEDERFSAARDGAANGGYPASATDGGADRGGQPMSGADGHKNPPAPSTPPPASGNGTPPAPSPSSSAPPASGANPTPADGANTGVPGVPPSPAAPKSILERLKRLTGES
jgi:hypothetical protein